MHYLLNGILIGMVFVGFSLMMGQHKPEEGKSNQSIEGILIPATTTMTTAWDIPRDPMIDSSLDEDSLGGEIRLGYRIFTNTQGEASRFTGNSVSCGNCHLNAGQRERALPLVGVAGVFPEYNKRAGRLFSLEDRIAGCFHRSENNGASTELLLQSKELRAVSSYITWLGRGYPDKMSPSWRGHNVIEKAKLLPIDRLDKERGEELFKVHCSNCHGVDGQGVAIGDKKAGPLWGPMSWNDGAGFARVYTLAGFIRYAMPYLNPGSLADEEAQHLAFYIDTKSRPAYPLKGEDYKTEPLPPDALYYSRSDRTVVGQ